MLKMFQEKICYHSRIKKNYSHGSKSNPSMFCKDCGEVVTPIKLKELARTKRNKNKKRK